MRRVLLAVALILPACSAPVAIPSDRLAEGQAVILNEADQFLREDGEPYPEGILPGILGAIPPGIEGVVLADPGGSPGRLVLILTRTGEWAGRRGQVHRHYLTPIR